MEEKNKKLGLLNVVGLCVGSGIGTGIFMMMGAGIAYAGRSILLVCGIGCVYMLLAFWYSLAFGSMFVIPGGDYDCRAMVFPPLLSGVSAWFQLASAFVLAGHSLAITQFAAQLYPQINEYQSLFSVLVLTLGFLCSIRGSRVLTIIQNLFTVTLIVALALFLVYGVPKVDAAAFFSNADGQFWHGGMGGFMGGAVGNELCLHGNICDDLYGVGYEKSQTNHSSCGDYCNSDCCCDLRLHGLCGRRNSAL